MIQSFSIPTHSTTEMIDITDAVQKIVKDSGINVGMCIVYISHTTAAVTINENADPSVTRDILSEINKVIPFSDNYKHHEGNSAAHIKASLFGASELLIIEDGQLLLGTWQGIYFCEFDGPRTRKVFVKVAEG